jgi:hypothetical protein
MPVLVGGWLVVVLELKLTLIPTSGQRQVRKPFLLRCQSLHGGAVQAEAGHCKEVQWTILLGFPAQGIQSITAL